MNSSQSWFRSLPRRSFCRDYAAGCWLAVAGVFDRFVGNPVVATASVVAAAVAAVAVVALVRLRRPATHS